MRPNRPNQVFKEDVEKLPRGTKLILSFGRHEVTLDSCLDDYCVVHHSDGKVQCAYYHANGMSPHDDGHWSPIWVELAEEFPDLRWQEVGF